MATHSPTAPIRIAAQIRIETDHSFGSRTPVGEVPRRQQRVARTERHGDRRGAEESGEHGEPGRRDDAEQAPAVVAVPDRGPVGRLGGLGGVAGSALRGRHPRSRLSRPPRRVLQLGQTGLAASRAVSALTAPRGPGPGTSRNCLARCSWPARSRPVAGAAARSRPPRPAARPAGCRWSSRLPCPHPGASGPGQLERSSGQAALAGQRRARGPAGQLGDALEWPCSSPARSRPAGALVG